MSVAFTNLTFGSDTDGNASATTASVTLLANRLHLLTVTSFESDGSTSEIPTCTGWELVETNEYFTSAGVLYFRVTVLRRMPGSDTTAAQTIDFNSVSQVEVNWSIDQSDANVDTTGTNGSGAIVQTAENSATSTTTITATLGAFGSTDNGTFGAAAYYGGGMTAWTEGAGFTALAEIASGFSADTGVLTQYRIDNDTSVDVTVNTTVDGIGIIALEIKAASGGSPPALMGQACL